MKTILFVNKNSVLRESLPLFPNLLVEARSDHIQEPVKLGAFFYLLDKVRDFLNREIDLSR